MSTVLIKEHTEHVTNLIPQIVEERIKSPIYRSKYHMKPAKLKGEDLIKLDFTKEESVESKKFDHRTFGVACVPRTPPTQFLKKKSRIEPPRPEIKHVHYKRPGYPKSLPAWVPVKRSIKSGLPELPQDPTVTARKNFKLENIVNVKRSRPQQPKKRYVDTRYGSAHDLEASGLLPIYIHRADYGKIPSFVSSKNIKKEEENDETRVQPLCRYITATERAKLLEGMKKKWDELQKEFQCLPFVIDTLPRITRKTQMEDALKQLEKDIDMIEKHPYIYVYSDSEED
ncbi:enkurin [Neodiprion lecontei]|uniref:Enkurin n=1 Tax=Neodiprion lecontei TaxID=441921 RepID=A0A6J0C074_NEOLC|nr:enkurin [Neodiprion lecontei]